MEVINNLDLLIVEDSLSYSLELEQLCEELGFNVIGTVEDSGSALDAIFSDNPDLILMDIDIKGKLNGLEIGQKIKHLGIPILYVTSFGDQFSLRSSSEANTVGYLVKPVSASVLLETLRKIVAESFDIEKDGEAKLINRSPNARSLFVQKGGEYKKIFIDQITYVKSEDNYCRFHLVDGSNYMMRVTLSEVEHMTKDLDFLRCHRSYIVNLSMITQVSLKDTEILLGENDRVPFSRSKKDLVKASVGNN